MIKREKMGINLGDNSKVPFSPLQRREIESTNQINGLFVDFDNKSLILSHSSVTYNLWNGMLSSIPLSLLISSFQLETPHTCLTSIQDINIEFESGVEITKLFHSQSHNACNICIYIFI